MRNDDVPFSTRDKTRGLRGLIKKVVPTSASRIGVIALAVLVVGLAAWYFYDQGKSPAFEVKAAENSAREQKEDAASGGEDPRVVVYVSGAVATPGVYSLGEGSRVNDAVELAGGFLENADPSSVNLARVVSDGEQISIPTTEQVEESRATQSGSSVAGASGLVNINTADVAALQTLSGVGEATARAIVADRDKNGPFASLEDLMRVDGIGEKKFAKIRDSICL